MMRMLKKWKVVVEAGGTPVVLFISDDFVSNVLRRLSELQFEREPTSITIRVADPTVGA